MELLFDEAAHCYRYGGVVVPSVTQILEDDAGLIPSYPSGPYRFRGSQVHRATELWERGELDNYQIGEEIALYTLSYAKLMQELKYEWLCMERRMFHPALCFAGTSDRLGIKPMVADIKTGKTGRETGLQLAAYTMLALQQPDVRKAWGNVRETEVQRVKFELEKDGEMGRPTFYTDALDFDVFRGLVHKYVWKRKK